VDCEVTQFSMAVTNQVALSCLNSHSYGKLGRFPLRWFPMKWCQMRREIWMLLDLKSCTTDGLTSYEIENRCAFNHNWKTFGKGENRTNSGVLFHTHMAAEAKTQLPIVTSWKKLWCKVLWCCVTEEAEDII